MTAKHPLYTLPHYAIIDDNEGGMVCTDHVPLWGSLAVASRHLREGSFRIAKVMIVPADETAVDDDQAEKMDRADALAVLEIFTQSMFNLMDDLSADLEKGTDTRDAIAWHFSRVFGMFLECRDLVDGGQGSSLDEFFERSRGSVQESLVDKFTASLHRSIQLFNASFPPGSKVCTVDGEHQLHRLAISLPAFYKQGVGPMVFLKGRVNPVAVADVLSISPLQAGPRST